MYLLSVVLGRIFATCPEFFARAVCVCVANLVWYGMPSRRRLVMSNLRHAFPGKSHDDLKRLGWESCRSTAEMGLLAVASPYFSDKRVRAMITIDSGMKDPELKLLPPGPVIMVGAHTTLMEAVPLQLHVFPEMAARQNAVFFRPLDNPSLDKAVKYSRERMGCLLLSRKEGFKTAMEILRDGGRVGVLPDQNAGAPGAKSLLFGRLASTSELPGLLAEKFKAPLVAIWPERTGFWKCVMKAEKLADCAEAATATSLYNRWLERLLSRDEVMTSQWLWMHNRWKANSRAKQRLRLEFRRDILPADFATLGIGEIPRTGERFVLRMPNWLGDVVMALPLVRAIREGRPDAHVTLLAKKPFVALLESLGVAERVLALPDKGSSSEAGFFKTLREDYPDTHILFTNSFRGDNEARRVGAPQRFGMVRPGKWRPLLTHGWKMPESLDETRVHQTRVWEKWLREAHGLEAPLDLAPFRPASLTGAGSVSGRIGLVCGTENFPAKRWPVERWRELVALLLARAPGCEIRLFGTANDTPITAAVSEGFDSARVRDMAGKTGLLDYCRELTSCSVLACNDTGGMHLANMLGVPVVAVFGPTNPLRTGPVYTANAVVLQPPGCPDVGGADIGGVTADRVAEAVLCRLG